LYAVAIPAANALKELGYLVYVFNFNEYYFSYLVELQGTICEKDAKKMAFRKIDKTVIEKIENFGPDIVIDFTANNPEVLKTIRNMNIILTQWLVEDYTIISYWKYVASYYDFFFVLERGPLFEELLKVKAKKVKYLPVACDSKIYKPLKLSVEDYDKFGCDVAFMGVPRKERIKMLEFFTNFNLGIWGKGWGEIDGKLKRYIRNNGKWVSGEEAAKIYNASKIILNLQISPFDKQKKANFVSPKTFSIAGCKGFQIADYRYEMKDLFKIGEEIICFNNFEELKELVKYYLDNEIERKRISKKAYQRVKSEHTYEHRMQEMIDFIRRHV
jgi:spore maturation protein CgeB